MASTRCHKWKSRKVWSVQELRLPESILGGDNFVAITASLLQITSNSVALG